MAFLDDPLWIAAGIPAMIFLARLLDVSLGTIRIVFVSRGMRSVAPLIGFVEILIWLLAIGQVVQNLDRPINYIAYAGGFAAGTWAGLLLDERMALGLVAVRIIARQDATQLIGRLGREQFGVTSFAARGLHGRARLILAVIRRRELKKLLDIVEEENPAAFISISDVRSAREGYLPAGSAGRWWPFSSLKRK